MVMLQGCRAEEDDEEHTFASTKLGADKTLRCGSGEEDGKKISWQVTREGQNGSVKVSAEVGKFVLDGVKLIIKNVQEENLGVYRCFASEAEELESYLVDISLKLKKLPKSISIDEGSSTMEDLKCIMISSGQEVDFKWYSRPEGEEDKSKMTPICSKTADSDCSTPDAQALFDKKDKDAPVVPMSERSKILLGEDDGVPFSVLTITDTALADRQTYICVATLRDPEATLRESIDVVECVNSKHCDMAETILRVKDPLAAVWPFCGIVVEVVLLCLVIFFCEKRKGPAEKEDDYEGSNGNNVAAGRRK